MFNQHDLFPSSTKKIENKENIPSIIILNFEATGCNETLDWQTWSLMKMSKKYKNDDFFNETAKNLNDLINIKSYSNFIAHKHQ